MFRTGITIVALMFGGAAQAEVFVGTATTKTRCAGDTLTTKFVDSIAIDMEPGSSIGEMVVGGTALPAFTDQNAKGQFMLSTGAEGISQILVEGKVKNGRLKGNVVFHTIVDGCFGKGKIKAR